MSRYIDADKLDKEFNEILDNPKEYDKPIHDMLREFYFAPTEDVEPVRHGHWIREYIELDGCFKCSECGIRVIGKPNYCPDCGAKMDEEEKDHE